jgi:hypothetical protein
MRNRLPFLIGPVALLAGAAVFVVPTAEARLTRITVQSQTVVDFPSFGKTGAYYKIAGTFEGELDPSTSLNSAIADIELAKRPAGSRTVHYKSTFFILRPVDLAKGNRKLFYDFGNRGNKRILQWINDATEATDPTAAEHYGNGFLMRQGYIVALSGWAGDVAPGANIMSVLELPIAVNPDGTSIQGKFAAETIASATTTGITLQYTADPISPTNGVLRRRERQTDDSEVLTGQNEIITGWTYNATGRRANFPAGHQVKPGWVYEFAYQARDPLVMGIGHAMTRDFLSFLKYDATDDFNNPNPVLMPARARSTRHSDDDDDDDGGRRADREQSNLRAIYSWGRSNGGRVERDLLRWGFNEDESGRIVIDGMMPYATGAGGHLWMNFRFSQPGASSRKHERHFAREPEFPHSFPVMTDPLTGERDGILRRCRRSDTCPKFFNIDGGNEYWNKSSSLNHTDAFGRDLNLAKTAPDVRVYYVASTDHNTEFDERPEWPAECQQMTNPLYNGPVFRALSVALDRWVTRGIEPPRSRVPMARDGTLVAPERVRFPSIPATHYAGWGVLPASQYTPRVMNRNAPLDFTKVPPEVMDRLGEYTVLVPQVDKDGNDVAGIRLPYLEVPLATHTGWSLLHPGAGFPDSCGQHGQFFPFANTKAERAAAGDPRKSIEERYRDRRDYVRQVAHAAKKLVKEGFLLEEDEDRIVARAERSGVQLWLFAP